MQQLQTNTLVFYTGLTRSASSILKAQQDEVAKERKKQKVLLRMVELARQLKAALQENNVEAFGEIIHENWILKKSLTDGITSSVIDEWYSRARKAGAVGGKLLGAGSGGFLMFYTPQEKQEPVARELAALRQVVFRFEPQGSKIIFIHD
jgi:D-glycero-alpha-D-manno-heptose-7-phosphate kinase